MDADKNTHNNYNLNKNSYHYAYPDKNSNYNTHMDAYTDRNTRLYTNCQPNESAMPQMAHYRLSITYEKGMRR